MRACWKFNGGEENEREKGESRAIMKLESGVRGERGASQRGVTEWNELEKQREREKERERENERALEGEPEERI